MELAQKLGVYAVYNTLTCAIFTVCTYPMYAISMITD